MWRFRLNEGTILEVSAPEGPTEKQVRRRGRVSLVLGTFAVALVAAAVALADGTSIDGDTTKSPPNVQYAATADSASHACTERGTAVSGVLTVNFNGNTHYNQGAPVTVTVDPESSADAQGITATGGSATVPSGTAWNGSGDSFAIPISTTVPATATDGTYSIAVHTSGAATNNQGASVTQEFDDSYRVAIECPSSNQSPVVDAGGPYSGAEGSPIALAGGSASDTDGPGPLSHLWTIEGTPSVDGGSCSLANATSLSAATITCTDNGAATVRLTTTEAGVGGESGSDTAPVTISNESPAIMSASFGAGSPPHVACATDNASLAVSFTDAGSNDTHAADVDWDGSTPPVYDQNVDPFTSGSSISHTYSGGSHTAKVRVTDDDGGESDPASATVVVDYDTSGILQPVNDTRNGQPVSVFKYKSTIPVKTRVTDCDGSVVSNLAPVVSFKKLSGDLPSEGSDEAASTVPPTDGNTMRWDSVAQQYIYNLATKQLGVDSSATYRITVTIQAGQTVYADIGIKP